MVRAVVVALVALHVATAAAAGEHETVTLAYTAPASCPDRATLEAAIHERTPAVTFGDRAARTFAITITEEAGQFRGALVVDGGDPRELGAARCDDLVSALALVTALAIDPAAATAPRPKLPVVAPAVRVERHAARPSPWRPDGMIGAMLEVGVAPDPLPAGVIEARFTRGRLELAVAGLGGYARSTVDSARASFLWLAARPSGCLRLSRRFDLGACGHVEAGVVRAAGDIVMGRSLSRLWIAAGGHLRGQWQATSSISLQIQAGASAPLQRDHYLFAPNVTVHETPAVTAWICAGVGVRFP